MNDRETRRGDEVGKLANLLLPTLDRLLPRTADGDSDKIDHGLRGNFSPPK